MTAATSTLAFDPLVFAAFCTSAVLALFAPVVAAVWVRRATGAPWLALGWGVLTFTVSQIVLRLPWQIALGVWLKDDLQRSPSLLFAWVAFSAVTAALFEETGRYVAFRRFFTKEHSFRAGLMFGVGHGGIESILLVGLTIAGNAAIYFLLGHDVSLPLTEDVRATIVRQLAPLTPGLALMGGVERLSSLCVHVAATLMVLRAVTTKELRWYGAALAYHALGNLAGVETAQHFGPFLAEAVIAAFAALGIAFVLSERRRTSALNAER